VVSEDQTNQAAAVEQSSYPSSVALLEPYDDFFASLSWLPEASRKAEAADDAQNSEPASAALWTPLVAATWSTTSSWTPAHTGAAPPTKPRTTWSVLKRARIVVLVVAVLAGGARGVQSSLAAKTLPPHPAVFDPRVLPIVSFIEAETGQPFKYPITLQFIDEGKFENLSILNDDTATNWKASKNEDPFLLCIDGWGNRAGKCDPIRPLTEPSTDAMFLRFLGVDIARGVATGSGLSPRVSLGKRGHRYNALTKRDIIGFYDPKTITIYVRGTNLDAVRQTVAHELVHAWQDQHGVLDRFKEGVDSEYVHLAIVEGHAEMVSDRYLATLSSASKEAVAKNDEDYGKEWAAKENEANPEVESPLEGANMGRLVELSLGIWPYEAGPEFLGTRSKEQVRDLLKKPPASTWDIMNPTLDGTGRGKKIPTPTAPGPTYTKKNYSIGPLFWSAGLKTVLQDESSRTFRNAWVGDSAVVYQQTGSQSVCLLDRIEFIDQASRGAAQVILARWTQSHPMHTATISPVEATQIDVNVCS
jgi:hypothetical protein